MAEKKDKPRSKWTKDNRKKPYGSKCEAKTRTTGEPCKRWAMPNGRCRLHGGKAPDPPPAPKGHKRSLVHGLYSSGLTQEEKTLYKSIKIDELDDELRMLKLKLRKAYKAQRMWEEQQQSKVKRRLIRSIEMKERLEEIIPDLMTIRIEKSTESRPIFAGLDENKDPIISYLTTTKRKVIRRKTDFSAEIIKLSNTIARLAIRRKELLETAKGEDLVKKLVKDFRTFADDAAETLPGGKM